MMKTALFAAAAAVSLPALASAQTFTLTIDPATGEAVLAGDAIISGIEIISAGNALLPDNAPIQTVFGQDFLILGTPPGGGEPEALTLLANTTERLAGGNTGEAADLPSVSPTSLGEIINVSLLGSGDAILADLSFSVGLDDNTEVDGTVTLIPEPTTLSLAALGGVALLRRRR